MSRLRLMRATYGDEAPDESGAILVLALVFMVVTALLVTGLSSWVGNDINNIGTVRFARSALYAADGAIQVATANTRYTYPASLTPGPCPNSPSQPPTDPFTLNTQSIDVWCSETVSPPSCPISSCSRTEVLSAYPLSQCPTPTTCSGKPYVQTEVFFDDNTTGSTSFDDCFPGGAQTTCGTSMTVYSYVVQGSNS